MLRLIFVLCLSCRALRLSEVPANGKSDIVMSKITDSKRWENSNLIFDVGMNRGDDTKAYLDKGYKVVSIEANPVWARKGGELFKDHIENGKLTIKNMAMSEVANQRMTFYVIKYKPGVLSMVKWLDALGYLKHGGVQDSPTAGNAQGGPNLQIASQFTGSKLHNESTGLLTMLEHVDEMSSLSKDSCLASGCGPQNDAACECKEEVVQSTTCADLINEFGTPHYLKIDIEGFDGYCMRNIATLPCEKMPAFISFEEQSIHNITRAIVAPSDEIIRTLSARGYKWKVSRQTTVVHAQEGSGPFGDDVEDFVHGKKWVDGSEATKQANLGCWDLSTPNVKESFQYDCDVHGKFDFLECKGFYDAMARTPYANPKFERP